jgi:hypothetical protein
VITAKRTYRQLGLPLAEIPFAPQCWVNVICQSKFSICLDNRGPLQSRNAFRGQPELRNGQLQALHQRGFKLRVLSGTIVLLPRAPFQVPEQMSRLRAIQPAIQVADEIVGALPRASLAFL